MGEESESGLAGFSGSGPVRDRKHNALQDWGHPTANLEEDLPPDSLPWIPALIDYWVECLGCLLASCWLDALFLQLSAWTWIKGRSQWIQECLHLTFSAESSVSQEDKWLPSSQRTSRWQTSNWNAGQPDSCHKIQSFTLNSHTVPLTASSAAESLISLHNDM